jgi:biofilm PGA synthesis N-glycosyltransferase PgaC
LNERALSYAVVTPARDEVDNLERLAACLLAQTIRPTRWVIVDTGSEDGTPAGAEALAAENDWIRVVSIREPHERGGPIVRAFMVGVVALDTASDVIVKLDADISFEDGYFAELLRRFDADPKLGIASGTCLEQEDGRWRERHVTGGHVWGACRAYRARCLAEIRPLEERMGWDGIDAYRANARGWHTATFKDIPFRHHRGEGIRDGLPREAWLARGRAAHYMGYRPSFLVLRALRHAVREPAAFTMVAGFLRSALAREPRCPDAVARRYLRRQQRLRALPLRSLESLGKRPRLKL